MHKIAKKEDLTMAEKVGGMLNPGELVVLEATRGWCQLITMGEALKKYPENSINPETGEWAYRGRSFVLGKGYNPGDGENVMMATFNPMDMEQLRRVIGLASEYVQEYWDDNDDCRDDD